MFHFKLRCKNTSFLYTSIFSGICTSPEYLYFWQLFSFIASFIWRHICIFCSLHFQNRVVTLVCLRGIIANLFFVIGHHLPNITRQISTYQWPSCMSDITRWKQSVLTKAQIQLALVMSFRGILFTFMPWVHSEPVLKAGAAATQV